MGDKNLIIDDMLAPLGSLEWTRGLSDLVVEFEKGFSQHKNDGSNSWLANLIKDHLPEKNQVEIESIVSGISDAIKVAEEKKSDLKVALGQGRSKENWFASEMEKATSAMSVQDAAKYIENVDSALKNANNGLLNMLKTQSGTVNMNPKLDGFIAEQYHAETFNMNAAANGSKYRAEVLKPEGTTFAKNSVDIVVKDSETGKIVQRYQSKYCKNPSATQAAINHGDYVGQQYLVPEGQAEDVHSKATESIVAPDGTSSNPLPKARAEQMRNEAQSGNWNDLNWNEYKVRDLGVGIGKQACIAGIQGAAVGAGLKIAQNLFENGSVDGDEVIETALRTGADVGVKTAAAGAMKVAVEKGVVDFIPKGTSAATFANIAFVAVEDAKILAKMADGELNLREGVDALECTTVSCAAGLAAGGEGAAIGATLGSVLGPVGTLAGSVVGSVVGYVAGSTVGKAVIKGAQMVRDVAYEGIKCIGSGIKSAVSTACNFVSDVWDTVTGGCFITTAICNEFGKPDDCYELTTLRKYRDEWLAKQTDGTALIREYYSVAPFLVKMIDRQPDHQKIYRFLNTKYLSNCVSLVEKGLFEACKEAYIQMVEWLKVKCYGLFLLEMAKDNHKKW